MAVTPPAAPGVAGGALVSPLRPAAGTPAGAPPPSPGVTGAVGEGAAAAVGLMSMSVPKDAVKGAHEAQAAGVAGHPGLPHRPLARVPPPRFEPAPQDLPLGFPANAPASVLSPGSGLMPPPPVRGSTAGGAAPVAEPGRELAVPAPAQAAPASSAGTAPAGKSALEGKLRELQATAADAQRNATIADAAVAAVAQVLAIKQAVAVHARAEATAARERLALALQKAEKAEGGGPATVAEEKGREEGC